MATLITPNKKTRVSLKTSIFVVILVVVSFGAGLFLGGGGTAGTSLSTLLNRSTNQSKSLDFNLFWDVWSLLDKKYVQQPVDEKKRFYGAIRGMVASLGDPYTAFMDPDETKQFQSDLDGNFDGIGIEIGIRDDLLTVVAPLENSPAAKAGIKSGDIILKIDDQVTTDMTLQEAVSKIRGEKGSTVKLTLTRDKKQPFETTVVRDNIAVNSVKVTYKNDVAIVEISRFGDTTLNEMNQVATEIATKGIQKIVIDVRNNPGGFLQSAIDVGSLFIPDGTIVQEVNSKGEKTAFPATGNAKLKDAKVVVLINEGSASAAEILAGALHDRKQAPLIGKKSFGKGSVQEVTQLSDGSSVRVTVAKWLTPNGTSIDHNGVNPDTEVELTDEDINKNRDPQLDKAIEAVKALK